jgi:flavodoxin
VGIVNYKVIYFTRTGNSRRVAEKIANKLSLEALEIRDNMNWKGISGFIKGGYYASKNKNVEIKIPENLDDSEELIVVTPLWVGKVAPAINTFLKTKALEKIHLVVTSGSTKIKDRSGYKSVCDIVKSENNEDAVISNFVNTLV